jgi:hypothetical protein
MIHEAFPSLTEPVSGSHPCCVVSVTYDLISCFHGGNIRRITIGTAYAGLLPRRTQGEQNLPAVLPAVGLACGDYQ